MERVAHNTVIEIMENQNNAAIMEDITDSGMCKDRKDREYVEDTTESVTSEERNVEDTTDEVPFFKTEKQLCEFVVLVIMQVLKKSGTLKDSNMEMLLCHIQRLVLKTMQGLPVMELQLPNGDSKEVAKAVVTELRAKYGKTLKYMLLLQDLCVEDVIIECFQAHIRGPTNPRCGKSTLDNIILGLVLGSLFVISIVIIIEFALSIV